MYTRPKLTDSVSVSEMMAMRESGLTNAEIAQRLDTSVATIHKYIGKQPAHLNKPSGWAAHHAKKAAEALERQRKEAAEAAKAASNDWQAKLKAAQEELAERSKRVEEAVVPMAIPPLAIEDEELSDPWTGGLKVISRITHAESARYRYTVDSANGTVKASDKETNRTVCYSTDALRSYVEELTSVLKMLETEA